MNKNSSKHNLNVFSTKLKMGPKWDVGFFFLLFNPAMQWHCPLVLVFSHESHFPSSLLEFAKALDSVNKLYSPLTLPFCSAHSTEQTSLGYHQKWPRKILKRVVSICVVLWIAFFFRFPGLNAALSAYVLMSPSRLLTSKLGLLMQGV